MIISLLKRCSVFLAFLFLFLVSINTSVKAQDFEEWKENYLNEFEEFQNEYDKQFHKMLQNEWKQFDIELSPDFYHEPKPEVIPKVEKETEEPGNTVSPEEEEPEKNPKKTQGSVLKTTEENKTEQQVEQPSNTGQKAEAINPEQGVNPTFEPNVKQAEVQTNNITYFNVPITYKYYAAYKTRVDRPIGNKSISSFWKHLSTKDYPSFLKQMQQIKSQLSLNDYGYAQLLEDIGNQIYGENSHEATLFTWFMLTQAGYGTRVAYNNQGVYLLIRTSPGVFRTTYFTIDGAKYYGLSFDDYHADLPNQLYTYEGAYPKSEEKELNLLFSSLPILPQKQETRTLSFGYNDTTYTFVVPVNQQIINYFKNYPKANLDLYLNSQMDGATHDKLISSLQPLLKGKSNLEKANILLRFVQESFEYQTDQQQFNVEKKMFPAETIYYPASDCDDRSILFAYLIKHLTDLQYILVRYPGHLTPAVHFPSNPPQGTEVGQPITHNAKSYYITDPTYFGADAGMIMTKYQNTQPAEIFDL